MLEMVKCLVANNLVEDYKKDLRNNDIEPLELSHIYVKKLIELREDKDSDLLFNEITDCITMVQMIALEEEKLWEDLVNQPIRDLEYARTYGCESVKEFEDLFVDKDDDFLTGLIF